MSEVNKEENIEAKLNELVKEFGPGSDNQHKKISELAQQAQQNHKELESLTFLQESLDYLRICIKYQLFDLEATRRENAYLRKLLEDREHHD